MISFRFVNIGRLISRNARRMGFEVLCLLRFSFTSACPTGRVVGNVRHYLFVGPRSRDVQGRIIGVILVGAVGHVFHSLFFRIFFL